MIFSSINPSVHVSTKNNYIYNLLGGGGVEEAQEILKYKTKWRFCLYVEIYKFIFTFWQDSWNPQNYRLAPQLP